jgi:UDP-N-acetylmuramoylalanine--D-glutamate ligase
VTDVQGKKVLVVGLARTGRAAAQCLYRRGAVVTVTDSRPPWALEPDFKELLAHRIGLELGLHRAETFRRQDLIVVSPGVLPELPELQAARKAHVPIVPEIEAAGWFLESELVGITGSNGKTTTTALLGKILEASGFRAFVGGNIGMPLISAVDMVSPDTIVVAELSSFQLEIIQDFRPHVAVLLNLTANHLDRHRSFDDYVRAKTQIFRNQTAEDVAVLNADDPAVMSLAPAVAARKVYFSQKQTLPEGVFVSDGQILYRVGNLERVLLETREVPLRGEFNVENVLAAATVACVLGVDFQALRRAVREFRAVEHRLEYVREIRGVEFYNDSKATSVDAVVKALSAFERGVHLILGGKDKGAPYAPLRALLKERVRRAYLIGAAAERIGREVKGAVELVHAGTLETAVRQALECAVPGDVILLSPACASFDQFQDYEHRGRVFKGLVEQLAQEVEAAEARKRAEAAASLASVAAVASLEAQPELPGEVRVSPESPVPASAEVAAQLPAPEALKPEVEPGRASEEVVAVEPLPEEPVAAQAAPAELMRVEFAAEPKPPEIEKAPEATQAAEQPPARSEPAEAPPRAVTYPELVYVYEVAAKEVAYPEEEPSAGPAADEFGPPPAEDWRAPESLADEALPFEVRGAARPNAAAAGAGPGGAEPQKAHGGDVKPAPPAGRRSRQKRLPGM